MSRPSFASIALVTCGLLLASVGGAAADRLITGQDVRNGSLTGLDVKNRSLSTADLNARSVRQLRNGPGATVRAWGRVNSTGAVTAKSPGLRVVRKSEGIYCISAPGVTRPAIVSVAPDYTTNATTVGVTNGDQSMYEVGDPQLECESAGPDAVVITYKRTYDSGGSTANRDDAGFYLIR